MRDTVSKMGDQLLSLFVPKAKVGACACGPWDNGWYYGCFSAMRYKHYCTFTCNCGVTCQPWIPTYEPCDT